MPNYAEMSKEMRRVFLEKVDIFDVCCDFIIAHSELPITPSLEEKINRIESLFSTLKSNLNNTPVEDNKKNYESNFIEFYLGYQNLFNKIAFKVQDSVFLTELGYTNDQQEKIREKIKSIQRQTFETVFFNREPIAVETIQRALRPHSHDVKNIIHDPNQGVATRDTKMGLYTVHVISLANEYAEKSKTMTGSYWTPANVFWHVQNEIIPLHDCIFWAQQRDNDNEISDVNKVIDRFSRVKKMGDYIFDYAKPLGETNILSGSVTELRRESCSLPHRDGNCLVINKYYTTIDYDGSAFLAVVGEYTSKSYKFQGHQRNSFHALYGQSVDLSFTQPYKHIYIFNNWSKSDNSWQNIDAIYYSPTQGDSKVPMHTYIYKNDVQEDYVVYKSQIRTWESSLPNPIYAPLSPYDNEKIVGQDDESPGDIRFTLPPENPSILIAEYKRTNRKYHDGAQLHNMTRIIHFLNSKPPIPLAFGEGK